MKFTVNKRDIQDVLSKVQGLTGRKSNLAITENVLIRSTDTGISILATDLETGFEGIYPAEIENDGIIAINARKFYEIIKEFPNDDICVNEVENRWIEIGSDQVLYHIVGMNPDDFPENPVFDAVPFFEMDSRAFRKMIDNTVIVTGASDDKRAHITGIFMERIVDGDQKLLRMVSTDGSRLNKADFTFEPAAELKSDEGILIPKKGLNEVAKFLDSEGLIQIGIQDNNFILKKDRETIIVRLLEGEFPQYSDIIQKMDGHVLKLDKKLFLMMLKRMSILSSENYKGVIFNFKEGQLKITATNPDIGESKEEMPIDFKGDEIEVAFNPKYFIDTGSLITGDTVVVNIINAERPCLIEGVDDNSFLSVIMPMRI